MVRVAAKHRMVFQLTEAPGEGHVIGATDVLVPEEQHAMLEQLGTDLSEQARVMNGIGKVDAGKLGANVTGKLFDLHDE